MKELRKIIKETLYKMEEESMVSSDPGETIDFDTAAIDSFTDSFMDDIETLSIEKDRFKNNKKFSTDSKEKAYFDHMEKEKEDSEKESEKDLEAVKNIFTQAKGLQQQNDDMKKQADAQKAASSKDTDFNVDKDMLNIS